MNKNKNILNLLEQNKTSTNFTDKVMKDIYALDSAKEKALKNSIQKNSLLSVSEDFTQNVLLNIHKQQSIFKPIQIFSFTQKITMAVSVLLVLILSSFSKNNSNIFNINFLNSLNFNISFIPSSPIMSISIICITLLLLIDYSLKKVKAN